MEVWNKLVGKKVFVILKSKRQYAGVVEETEDEGNGLVFISITDTKGHLVVFSSGEIEMIQEEE